MITRIIVIYFLIVLFTPRHLCAQLSRKLYMSRCLSSEPYMHLHKMSVDGCSKACAERNHCVAIGYHKVSKMCQLYGVITAMVPCVGFVVILKSDFPTGGASTCSGSCPISDCTTIPSINNAEMSGNLLDIGAAVKVQCLNDDGVSYIECQPNGQWTPLPTCSDAAVSCGTPSGILNSDVTHSSTLVGSVATYACQSGYSSSPSGASMSINCLNTAQWETASFTCQQVDCGSPSNVGNSQKTFTSTTAGASATYTCDSGYTVSPSGTSMSITCLNTGQWETISFTCQQVDCGSPSDVGNAQKTFTSTLAGASATYTCDSGYTVSPSGTSMSINCLNTGQWETISFTCQQVGCGTPPDVGNTQKTFTSTTAGSSVTYTCDSGYTVSPSGTTMSINCLNTGQWETISFTCQQVDCGSPSNVGNSQKTVASTLAGASATYTCDSGYTVSPSGTTMSINCLNTGQWETISFTCQQVDCGSPSNVGNSQKTVASTLAGASATYTCDSGYTVSPSGTSMSINCLNTGQWETISFTCQQVGCGTPPDVGNTQKTFTSTTAGSSVTYTCDSGYTVSPSGTTMSINCLNTGQWETISFTCQQVDCGSPSNVGNSQKTVASTLAGASATYTCDSGYTVSPSGTTMSINCLNTGQWETISFTCQQVDCGSPSNVGNSQKTVASTLAGASATYTCDSGYTVSPSGTSMSINCLNTGQWETISFTCQQVGCGTPPDVGNTQKTFTSTTAGSSVTYTCDSGYTVSPSGTTMSINCLNTGQWETISFTCQQVDCGSPSNVGNSQKTVASTLAGASATYTCDSGYTVSPSGTSMSINCLNTGQWETISFTCQQVGCGTPPDVGNTQKTFTSTTAGSSVTYTCDSGYTVSPSGTTMSINCLNTGQWETISFTCQQVDCGSPSDVGNSQKTVTSTLAGASATYTCDSGYTVSPSGTSMSINCLNTGQWETISFTCQQVDCGSPSNVGNSQKTVASTLAGASATYTCDSGYTVSPSGTSMSINCLNTGQWETISFTCQQVDCGSPSNVGNSQKTVASTLVGASATYTCDSGYTVSPSGTSMSINCLNTGQWEAISFTCQQVDCGSPSNVGNSQKTVTSTLVGASATYTCDSGYTVSPSGTSMSINCLNTGQWETISFTCQQVDCGTPSDVSNSQKTFTSTLAGASVTYTCDSSYTVSPPGASMSLTCQQTGVWETISFSCAVSASPGSSCSTNADCAAISAICLYTGIYSTGSRCYCKPLYEYSYSQSVCTQACASYTMLQKYSNEYIKKHNVGDSNGNTLNEAECLQFCEDNYGDSYLSVDHRHARTWGTNCYCGSVTRKQAQDSSPDLLLSDSEYNIFTKTCS